VTQETKPYLVLARKYRPKNFSELIGQDALVATLTNAIKSNRIAHAFILTGIRGVGKTTSARIIAKALNCIGIDGKSGPTPEPCGVCEQCVSIAEDRNVDVIEADAASRTGVGDIREIIDNVRYVPVAARYKIYIIDEVHMLSKSAFNALLKTLEEPPPHVKFIFATTEIRKIPLTILSRCQRFDLLRVPPELLVQRFSEIAGKEGFLIDQEALGIIAKAAEGSVRDGLSILDQALSRSGGNVIAKEVKELIGITDHNKIFDLFELAMAGKPAEALASLRTLYDSGSDPVTMLEDLLELTHYISVTKHSAENPAAKTGAGDKQRAIAIAEKLSVPALVGAWQILLKSLAEARTANNSLNAAEMAVIKLSYTSGLPGPNNLVKNSQDEIRHKPSFQATPVKSPSPEFTNASQKNPVISVNNFRELVELFSAKEEHVLHGWLVNGVHLVSFERGRLEFRPSPAAPQDLAGKIGKALTDWTGERWLVVISNDKGATTLRDDHRLQEKKLYAEIANDPNVAKVLESFPGAEIIEVRERREESLKAGEGK